MKPANLEKNNINWDQARSRLLASDRALQESLFASPQRIETAYRQRAVRLAAGQAERAPVSAVLPVLVFRLADERYALELKELAEVLPFARCAPVPGGPPQFLGVINLRGELRAVVDLARLLVPSANGNRDSGFVLMLRRPGREIGLKVDRIEQLDEIRREELSLPAPGNHVKGIAGGRLMLLDIDQVVAGIFSQEESLTT